MTPAAPRLEDHHYCARCKVLIEDEEKSHVTTSTMAVAPVIDIQTRTTLRGAPLEGKGIAVATIPPSKVPLVEAPPLDTVPKMEVAQALAEAYEATIVAPPLAKALEADPSWDHIPQRDTPVHDEPVIDPAELRSSSRKKVEVDIGIHSDSHFFAGLTGDVSHGGLFVATYAELTVGSKIMLDFELPNGKIVVEGTVRWHRFASGQTGPGYGVQFEDVDDATMAKIERFCQARPPLYYDQADDLE
ncbi:MAG: PilZ domain-containing protein [Polyangiaceae bacterium]